MADPYCLAMVLCDNVHMDSTTGKQTILGTFSTVGAKDFPTRLEFAVYYAITDAVGDLELTFRIVDSKHGFEDNQPPVLEKPFQLNSPTPLAVMEGRILVDAVLPEPSVYHCELLADGNVLMSRRLVAVRPSDLAE